MSASADHITALYERHARAWDRDRSRHLSEKAWLDRFLALLPPRPSVLDLGCGMAEPIARYCIESGCVVTGIDASPTMIGLCRARFPAQNWIVADMRGLALERRFDGILAWDSFCHLRDSDQRAMFPIFRAHAGPGSALLFTSGPAGGEAIGCYRDEAPYHASLDPDTYRALLAGNGFSVRGHVAQDPDCTGHTVWLARQHQS
jgi:SAM-dependent methyltransferase